MCHICIFMVIFVEDMIMMYHVQFFLHHLTFYSVHGIPAKFKCPNGWTTKYSRTQTSISQTIVVTVLLQYFVTMLY